MKRLLPFFLVVLVLLATASAQYKYTTPNCPGMYVTNLFSINNNGTITGSYYTDSDPLWHPMVIKGGRCIALLPESILGQKFGYAFQVNDRSDVVGVFYDDGFFAGRAHGFLVDKHGVLTIIDFPSADGTGAWGISASGTIVGWWYVTDSDGNLVFEHGFILKDGVFSEVIFPGPYITQLGQINARGDIIGTGIDTTNGIGHGFVYSHGVFTELLTPPPAIGEAPMGINDKGVMVGQYLDQDYNLHGFLKAGSAYTTMDYPGAAGTGVNAINNAGQMVGAYLDGDYNWHGYLVEKTK